MRRFPLRALLLIACSFSALCALPVARTGAQKGPTSGGSDASILETEILQEINRARTNPAAYAAYLDGLKPRFNGKEFKLAERLTMTTQEGVAVVEEAASFLRSTAPVSQLAMSRGMCSGARVLVGDQGTSGVTGHKGGDGSFCEQRIERYGAWNAPVGENLSYGNDSARDRVVSLIVDDGVANRGHRKRIFDPAYKVAGVACGTHQLGTMCVITFAGGFTDRTGAPAQASVQSKSNATPPSPAGVKRF
ncbi:MAG: CAP domain-containing protein [Pyrinomonadaceae bacterium]